MQKEQPKIKVDGLYKIFGEKPEKAFPLIEQGLSRAEIKEQTGNVVALRDINFEVKQGEVFVVMGLSGSGKSTLIRCVNRLIEATRGAILIDDKSVNSLSRDELIKMRRRRLGMVFQRFALFPHRSVLENVTFGLEIQGISQQDKESQGREALQTVGLGEWTDNPIYSLSGGMQQRVGLARALAIDPEILLMDEPFSALDPLIRSKMQDELLRLQQKIKKTILFITHDLNEAIRIGDRIGIINSEGVLVQIDTAEEILLNPADDYVESFIKDIDRPSVIRVESIMEKPQHFITTELSHKEALQKMESSGADYSFLLEKDKFVGRLEKGKVAKAQEQNIPLKQAADTVKIVHSINTIKDVLYQVLTSYYSVPVVDTQGNLIGEINRDNVAGILKEEEAATGSEEH